MAATAKPVIVTVPTVRSPDASIVVAPGMAARPGVESAVGLEKTTEEAKRVLDKTSATGAKLIDQAEQMGAQVRVDGRGANGQDGGYWVGPTILDNVTPEMPAAGTEIFGPVLSVIRVDTLEEALQLENELHTNPFSRQQFSHDASV